MDYLTISLGLLVFSQVLDLWLTSKALSLGAKEANPLSRWLIERVGNVWVAGILAKAPVLGLVWFAQEPVLTTFALVLYGWVVWNNYTVVKKLGG